MVIAAILVVTGMYLFGIRASLFPATPLNQFLIFAVIATLLAGIGNIFAAGVAAVGLSVLQSFSILVISSTWQILLIYIVLFIVILLFPNGVVLPGSSRKIQRAATEDALATVAAAPRPARTRTNGHDPVSLHDRDPCRDQRHPGERLQPHSGLWRTCQRRSSGVLRHRRVCLGAACSAARHSHPAVDPARDRDCGGDLGRAFAALAAGIGRLSGHRHHGLPARPRARHQQRRVHRRRQRPDQHSVDRRRPLSQRNLRRRRMGLPPWPRSR